MTWGATQRMVIYLKEWRLNMEDLKKLISTIMSLALSI